MMQRFIRILLLLFATIKVHDIWASEQNWVTTQKPKDFVLLITPQTCEVKQFGEPCHMTIYAFGPHNNKQSLCLIEQQNPTPLWCGVLGSKKTLLVKRKVEKNKIFRLVESDQTLASADIKVAVFQPVKLRKRRRYGLGL